MEADWAEWNHVRYGDPEWTYRLDCRQSQQPERDYIGATDGGVWKTIDAGVTLDAAYRPRADARDWRAGRDRNRPEQYRHSLYVGTSSFLKVGNQGLQLNTTIGILKSTDGGNSWIMLGSGFPAREHRQRESIRKPEHLRDRCRSCRQRNLYLAASSGLYFSTTRDRTGRWEPAVAVRRPTHWRFDASSPVGNRTLFAGVNGVGIKRSIDGGNNWSQVLDSSTPAVAAQLAAHSTLTSNATIGKVAISLAPSVGNAAGVQVIYATIEGTTETS